MIDVSPWPGLQLIERVEEGNRNEVWRGSLSGQQVAVRRSRRTAASLQWEVDLLAWLGEQGFCVPTVSTAQDGRDHADGIVVQRWITGRPPATRADWHLVAHELQRLHSLTPTYRQRPGCCTVIELAEQRTSVDADLDAMPGDAATLVEGIFASFRGGPTAVIHGDVGSSNIRITADGGVGLLDWDESRLDLTMHDLSPLGSQLGGLQVLGDVDHAAAQRLSNAWEAVNGWMAEPDYARRRLAALGEPLP